MLYPDGGAGDGTAEAPSAAKSRFVALALTDVVMPAMSGRAFAERLAAVRPEARVLYMSGYTDDEILRRGLAGPAAFLEKPFTPEALPAAVRRVLDEATACP